jgi:Holliday junction resolvase RusA-like endonuclease
MKIKFTICGEPRRKERPRVCSKRFKVFTYTPEKTSDYEKVVRNEFKENVGIKFKEKTSLSAKVTAYYKIPN